MISSQASLREGQEMIGRYVVEHEAELKAQYESDFIAVDVNGRVHGHNRNFDRLNASMARQGGDVLIMKIDEFKQGYEARRREEGEQ